LLSRVGLPSGVLQKYYIISTCKLNGGDNFNKRCLSTTGNLDHLLEFLGGYFSSMSRFFSAIVPELSRFLEKFQVSRFPEKSPDSRNNFGFVLKQRLLELSPPVTQLESFDTNRLKLKLIIICKGIVKFHGRAKKCVI